jgi:hypothetical protein
MVGGPAVGLDVGTALGLAVGLVVGVRSRPATGLVFALTTVVKLKALAASGERRVGACLREPPRTLQHGRASRMRSVAAHHLPLREQ